MIRLACVAIAATLLAACASAPVREGAPAPWPERRAALQADAAFSLSGRVAIRTGDTGLNASLRWRQEGAVSHVTLDGPLGIGGAEVELRGDELALRTSHGDHLEGDAARAELERRIGFPLPLAALRYWVRGVPEPGAGADEVVDEAHQRLASLVQDGWEISYTEYAAGSAGILPRRLSAQRGNTRVRLVIDRWTP
ncbi:MAG: Outer-membrane lipoprotein LolB [Steroidobacteraceae bacterium]|nr:Outer-membrane lipoprotein LolB [Steroidobacteraceae bacterium]